MINHCHEALDRGRNKSYNIPNKNMPVRVTFCALVVFKPQTMGTGRQSIRTSVKRFKAPLNLVKRGR